MYVGRSADQNSAPTRSVLMGSTTMNLVTGFSTEWHIPIGIWEKQLPSHQGWFAPFSWCCTFGPTRMSQGRKGLPPKKLKESQGGHLKIWAFQDDFVYWTLPFLRLSWSLILQCCWSFGIFVFYVFSLSFMIFGQFPTKKSTCAGGSWEERDLRDGGAPEELRPSLGPVTIPFTNINQPLVG